MLHTTCWTLLHFACEFLRKIIKSRILRNWSHAVGEFIGCKVLCFNRIWRWRWIDAEVPLRIWMRLFCGSEWLTWCLTWRTAKSPRRGDGKASCRAAMARSNLECLVAWSPDEAGLVCALVPGKSQRRVLSEACLCGGMVEWGRFLRVLLTAGGTNGPE